LVYVCQELRAGLIFWLIEFVAAGDPAGSVPRRQGVREGALVVVKPPTSRGAKLEILEIDDSVLIAIKTVPPRMAAARRLASSRYCETEFSPGLDAPHEKKRYRNTGRRPPRRRSIGREKHRRNLYWFSHFPRPASIPFQECAVLCKAIKDGREAGKEMSRRGKTMGWGCYGALATGYMGVNFRGNKKCGG